MRRIFSHKKTIIILFITVFVMAGAGDVFPGDDKKGHKYSRMDYRKADYQVTIHNLTDGQPFSPPVAATHKGRINMFEIEELASPGLEAIAEDGDQSMMFMRFDMSPDTSEAVDVGMPVMTNGSMDGGILVDAATFRIRARGHDRFSFAAMLICTNDGFIGLDRAKLPGMGAAVYLLSAYDANTEMNTQMSEDIVDACSAIGPVSLPDDPNGNENDAVDMMPHKPIALHPGIMDGKGDLTVDDHGWMDPVAKVTITRVNDRAREFKALLSGAAEVPPVMTYASGEAWFELNMHNNELHYKLKVQNIEGVTQAHIHMGMPNMNRPVVAFLFGPSDPTGFMNGTLAEGVITESDLIGPLAGDFQGLVDRLRGGMLYVNVHTDAVPSGEIRGQIGAGR
jgi:hypothetical protein